MGAFMSEGSWTGAVRGRRRAMASRWGAAAALLFVLGAAWSATGFTPVAAGPVSIEVREGTKLAFDLSADGGTIVFDLLGQLWTVPSSGGSARAVTHAVRDTSEDLRPVFASDGVRIAFRGDRPGGAGIHLASIDTDAVRRLVIDTAGVTVTDPAWAPDGKRIAFVRSSSPPSLQVLDLASGAQQALEIRGLPSQNRAITAPAWSPDGSRIAFVNASAFQQRGGRIWEVPAGGGEAQPLTAESVQGRAPSYSPDGQRLAFFSQDSAGRFQVFLSERGTPPRRVTSHSDVTPLSVRWEPGGMSLIYHADGRLWRISAEGGAPAEIPFSARVEFVRRAARLAPVRFPRAGANLSATGFMGLALSPSGSRIALIALDTLWVFRPGERPRAITSVPMTAAGVTWSPNEDEVAWSAGPSGAEDIFATRLAVGETRVVTALSGGETRPSWSPDGRHIAFIHTLGRSAQALAVDAARGGWRDADSTVKLGSIAPQPGFFAPPQEEPAWSPDGRGVLLGQGVRFLRGGDSLRLELPDTSWQSAFLTWARDSSIYFVNDELLWRAPFLAASRSLGRPLRVSNDPALYPSVARDGTVLFVSVDGLRLRRPSGETRRLGWPITRRVTAPASIVVAGGRLVRGAADTSDSPSDILVRAGRIVRIEPAGRMAPPRGARVVDARGKWVIPGLIDLHGHLWDDALLPGMLYYGVTAYRDMGSTGIARLAGHRDAIELGVRAGPRIVFGAIQFWGAAGGLSAPGAHAPSDDSARARAVAMLRAFNAGYLKMRWFADWTGGTKMIAAAHAAGWPVSGHEAVQLPLVAAGIDGQEHFGPSGTRTDQLLYEDIVRLYQAAGMWVVPTIAGYSSVPRVMADTAMLGRDESAALITPFLRFWQTRLGPNAPAAYARFAQVTRAATRRVREGGVAIGAGGDAPLPWALLWELEELVEAGLTPREAIDAATRTAARILGAQNEIGTLSRGAWADLVILDADPLQDIRNTRKIRTVIKGGQVVDRGALLRQVTMESPRPARNR